MSDFNSVRTCRFLNLTFIPRHFDDIVFSKMLCFPDGRKLQVRWVCSLRSSAWPDAFVMVWFNSTQDKKVHTLGHAGYEPWTGRAMKRRRGDGDGVPRPLKSVFIA